MASQLNVVTLGGNLTRDPELRSLESGTSLCQLRIANNRRAKVDGEWTDRAGFFDVTVWGAQGEACAKYLKKGSPVMVTGELRWREWEAKDGSGKRQAVDINAREVQFLRSGDPDGRGVTNFGGGSEGGDAPADDADLPPTGGGQKPQGDDDIPF